YTVKKIPAASFRYHFLRKIISEINKGNNIIM
ncbi:unnamed protein product, partial [marine sediment metagenome]